MPKYKEDIQALDYCWARLVARPVLGRTNLEFMDLDSNNSVSHETAFRVLVILESLILACSLSIL